MVGMATIAGGTKHGLAVLSHAERSAAENALSRLGRQHAGSASVSATVFGGVKASGLSTTSLVHGQGNDTFLGGARSTSTHALANIGNDTVLSGSATANHPTPEGRAQSFSLSSDTISVKGATAEGVKSVHPQTSTGSHTITLADKTTVTISGLSKHDISKLPH